MLLNIHDDSRHVFMGFVDGKGGVTVKRHFGGRFGDWMGKLLGDRDRVSDDCWLNNSCRVIPTTKKVGIRWRKK